MKSSGRKKKNSDLLFKSKIIYFKILEQIIFQIKLIETILEF